ncbi:Outer membrane protein OmpA [Loktanella sp. DSM 29012]|uniref:OmpA family protein n=1 Tax=Loktanella sp. DSM 29012 TaxID=1881056 RepID=UPI0008BB2BD4|nr:OmpA family protein [Loktanella sp. DSM 29012]SEQ41275.1 Outer membrane protein OmpA [Loktanella sp. DSM 29012]
MTFSRLNMTAASAALLLAAGCAGTGGPNDNQNARNAAMIGAGAGAVAGLLAGDDATERRQNALAGAALGAAAGAGIGTLLDRQEEELRRELGNNVGIVNNGNNLTVTLPQDILFATNSIAVSGAAQGDLTALARNLQSYPNSTVNVIGHTDNVGEAAFNFDLSQRRAQAVSSVLINAGVAPSRIRSIGRGEDQPIATNNSPEGRQQNRRVEIVITPN